MVVASGITAEATPGQGQASDQQQEQQQQQDDGDRAGACAVLCTTPGAQAPWQGQQHPKPKSTGQSLWETMGACHLGVGLAG